MALALLLWIPQGISHGDTTMVTGHSTFYNGDTYDPCLGSIAGIMRHRVMWFNDQVLVESYGGRGSFIYVTENGSDDPRDRTLYTDGVFYDFVDPNGAHWHVEELYMANKDTLTVNRDPLKNEHDPLVTLEEDRTYVWVVELAPRPIFDEFHGDDPHTYYNFLVLADTCKMRRDRAFDGIENHNLTSQLNSRNGHPNGETAHDHERFMVNLWVGKRPVAAPGGVSGDGANYETDWAIGETNQQAPDGPTPTPEDFQDQMPPEDTLP